MFVYITNAENKYKDRGETCFYNCVGNLTLGNSEKERKYTAVLRLKSLITDREEREKRRVVEMRLENF